jgi:hypothetical protein
MVIKPEPSTPPASTRVRVIQSAELDSTVATPAIIQAGSTILKSLPPRTPAEAQSINGDITNLNY